MSKPNDVKKKGELFIFFNNENKTHICLIHESSKHLIFECENVTEILNALGTL